MALALVGTTTIARADAGTPAKPDGHGELGAVVVYGKAKPHERQVVATAVTRTVHDASWSVSDAVFTSKDVDSIVTCLTLDRPWPCVAPLAHDKGIQRVVVVQVEPAGAAVTVTGQVLVPSDAVPSIERRFCDPCSDATLDQSAKELTTTLLERSIARSGNTAIEVHTVPTGASITIDGTMAGSSDQTIPVSAGQHQVQLQRSGYRPHAELVTVAEGTTFKLSTTLTLAEPVVVEHHEDQPSRLVPALVGGLGAVALVSGTVYSFTVGPPKSFEQSRYLYSGPGIALAAVGGAALGVGLYLWFHHPRKTAAPTVSYTSRGGVLGWITSF